MFSSPRNFFPKPLLRLALVALLPLCHRVDALPAQSADSLAESPAALAWKALKLAHDTPPAPLRQLPDHMYSKSEIQDYYAGVAAKAGEVADQARRFCTLYPQDTKAAEAREICFDMLHAAVGFGCTNRIPELEAATARRQKDSAPDEAARFQLSLRLLHSAVSGRQYEGNEAMRAELETRARKLAADYPGHPDGVDFLLNMARAAAPEKSAALAREILSHPNTPKITEECEGLIRRADAVGKPLELRLSLADGAVLDMAEMRGKVLCLFFWETKGRFSPKALWAVNELYKTYHSQGLDVWGVNVDGTPESADALAAGSKVQWPQYFDLPAGGKIRRQFGLYSLPAVWLVDKKGVLRELKAERQPDTLVKKLLAE